MAQILFTNFATSTLAGAITTTSLSLAVQAGSGVEFPSPGAGQYFTAVISDAATNLIKEVIKVTAVSGDTMTIVRAQQGTTASNWNAGDLIGNLLTAGDLAQFLQIGVDPPDNFAVASGTNNYSITWNLTQTTYAQGNPQGLVYFTNSNTATACTLNDGTKNAPLIRADGLNPAAGDANGYCFVFWDGANWRLADLLTISDVLALIKANTKTRISGATTLYVNSATGSDSNAGTSSAPFLTLQAAASYAQSNLDLNGQVLTFAATGNFTAGVALSGLFSGQTGPGSIAFAMGTSNLTSVAHCFAANGGAAFNVTGTGTFSSTGTGSGQGNVLNAINPGSQIQFSSINFGTAGVGHIFASDSAEITATGSYSVSSGGSYHISTQVNALFGYGVAITATATGSPNFTQAFVVVGPRGFVGLNSAAFAGTVNGPSLYQDVFGSVYYGSSVLPGNGATTIVPLPSSIGGTGYTGGALPTYSPSLTATSGSGVSFTLQSATYLKIGRMLFVRVVAQVTYSSAPGAVLIGLPISAANGQQAVNGQNFSSVFSLIGSVSSGQNYITVTKSDGTSPVSSSGQYVMVQGWLEMQS